MENENISVDELMVKIESIFIAGEEEALIGPFENITSLMRSTLYRNDLKEEHWIIIRKISEKASKILLQEKKSDEQLDFLASLLRFLRNSCGGSLKNLDNLLKTQPVLNFAKDALEHYLIPNSEKEKLILKISIQLFGNILLSNGNLQDFVWNIFNKKHVFRKSLCIEDNSIKECAMMVLCHCLNEESCKFICTNTEDEDSILHTLIDLYLKNEIQWIPDVMQHMLEEDVLFSSFDKLDSFDRCVLLDFIQVYLEEDNCKKVLKNSIEKLMELFAKDVSDIAHSSLMPYEIMKILLILCITSVKDSYMTILQNNQELLKVCLGTLKVVHLLRDQNSSLFSAEQNPSYHGFKSDLIRLIGNLSYKCKDNQNLVRNMDGIPLILDCSKMDKENPYIREWCVLAIRNLLENNLENQAIIAGIPSSGEVVHSEYLSGIGLEAKNEGGQIRIRPKPPKEGSM